ncbi:MAG: helix-turn-helix domain-containing protein, partial [Bacteroidales bacterium]|nr:helix-turn-helix domain-containing protein [Bacteroidales bacterium]
MKYTTIVDIARELGLSKSTVSRALSGDTHNVKPETMRLICETARRMG